MKKPAQGPTRRGLGRALDTRVAFDVMNINRIKPIVKEKYHFILFI